MSIYYDPWAHVVNLFMTRVAQYLFLSVCIALIVWASLIHWYFGASWSEVAQSVLAGAHIVDTRWRAIAGLCGVLGATLCGWLFTFLFLRGRLQGGERFHRGARVVHHGEQG